MLSTGWITVGCRDSVFIHHTVRCNRFLLPHLPEYDIRLAGSSAMVHARATDHTGVASDRPGMDRSTHPDGGPVHGEILKLPHNEALFDAIQARNGIVQLHSPQPEILQVDYAARKWPGITWLLDHMCANHDVWACTFMHYELDKLAMFGTTVCCGCQVVPVSAWRHVGGG